jgi:hypothetical protein
VVCGPPRPQSRRRLNGGHTKGLCLLSAAARVISLLRGSLLGDARARGQREHERRAASRGPTREIYSPGQRLCVMRGHLSTGTAGAWFPAESICMQPPMPLPAPTLPPRWPLPVPATASRGTPLLAAENAVAKVETERGRRPRRATVHVLPPNTMECHPAGTCAAFRSPLSASTSSPKPLALRRITVPPFSRACAGRLPHVDSLRDSRVSGSRDHPVQGSRESGGLVVRWPH